MSTRMSNNPSKRGIGEISEQGLAIAPDKRVGVRTIDGKKPTFRYLTV